MPCLELSSFRYRDRLTRKWVKARYVAERHEISARYAEWETIGAPEIRDIVPDNPLLHAVPDNVARRAGGSPRPG
jgi:hypothetical protein